MKLKKLSFDYITLIKYLLTAFCFYVFSNIIIDKNIFSTSIFISTLFLGNNLFINLILHLLTVFLLNNIGLFFSIFLSDIIIIIVYLFYRKYKVKMKIEIFAYCSLSLVPFIFIANTTEFLPYLNRIYQVVFSSFLSLVLFESFSVISKKGLKYKYSYEEYLFLIISIIIFGVGICNAFSPLIWKGISIFAILTLSFIYKIGITSLIASLLGLSVSIYYTDLTFIAIYLLLSISVECLMTQSRYISSSIVIVVDYIIFYFFKAYGTYSYSDFFAVFTPALIFTLIPTKVLNSLKDKLYLFREKQLTRLSINQNRVMLSNKLYDLSSVFNEIAIAFSNNEKIENKTEKEKNIIYNEIINSLCNSCINKNKCNVIDQNGIFFQKLIDIGMAKGKLTLIDFPKEICENCIHTNNLLFALNKLINEYKAHISKQHDLSLNRKLIMEETLGISDVLKGIALESGTTLKFQNKTERELANELFKNGFIVSELLIYGEGINSNISMILTMKEFSISQIERILKKIVGFDMLIDEKIDITDEKCYLSFKISAPYDAVFGLSFFNKDGSKMSGDTHSVTRIKDDKFLVALSDGMGSGVNAEKVSSASLSMIETFYKAGLKNQLILTTINKLLNINCDDNFTALDVAVIDLKNCSCDFIKYGSPYGFIISKEGIKIVESNNLPLGILEDIKPVVATTTLNDGDVILLCTDGISDSFGSSSALIDFLRTQPALNPQTLTDNLINKAVELSNGNKNDDMTVLAVRIFKIL